MRDARILLDRGEDAVCNLARRGYALDLSALQDLFARRNILIESIDDLRAESKRVAAAVGTAARTGGDTTELRERARQLKEEVRSVESEHDKVDADLRDPLLGIPNFVADGLDGMVAVAQRFAAARAYPTATTTPSMSSYAGTARRPRSRSNRVMTSISARRWASSTSAARQSCPAPASA